MGFREKSKNEALISRLEQTIKAQHVSHAYLFEGAANMDKKAFAHDFAKALLCQDAPGIGCDQCPICNKVAHGNHEDIFLVEADGKSIKDQAVETLQNRLKIKPLGGRNIAIINDADTLTLRAQNRLLKTLEEPVPGTVLILLSENMENLTQTILSRCIKYRLNYFGKESWEGMADMAKDTADMLLAQAPFYKVKSAMVDVMKDEKKTAAFLDAMEKVYRDRLLGTDAKSRLYKKSDIYTNVAAIEEARRQLQRGVAKGYALKNLMIKIGG